MNTPLSFTKMHGLGNDFIVFDFTGQNYSTNNSHDYDQALATVIKQIPFLADRKIGIGCDQVLFIEYSDTPKADFKYQIFNADGSTAGHCGNGARCVISYLYNHHKINKPSITLSIHDRLITGYKNVMGNNTKHEETEHKNTDDCANNKGNNNNKVISINMGTPQFNPESLPFLHKLNLDNAYQLHIQNQIISFGIASVGNPHVMVELPDNQALDNTAELINTARCLQNSALFPEGINVNFYVILNRNTIKLRTFERGCGFTLACGTGATATAAFAITKNLVGNLPVGGKSDKNFINIFPLGMDNHDINVEMQGGSLQLNQNSRGEMIMTGPAIEVFSGQIILS